MYIDSSEQSMGLLRAIDGLAPSNRWARSEQQAVSLGARGRFSASEKPFSYFSLGREFFFLGRAHIFAGTKR